MYFLADDFYEEKLTTIPGLEGNDEFKAGGSSQMKQIMISGRDSFISEGELSRMQSQKDMTKN